MERASAESKSGWFVEKQYIGGGDFDDKSIDDVSDGSCSVFGSDHGNRSDNGSRLGGDQNGL
jgi:hypothetical protein